jgi:hypothetical protein
VVKLWGEGGISEIYEGEENNGLEDRTQELNGKYQYVQRLIY